MSGQELDEIVQITVEDFQPDGRNGKIINRGLPSLFVNQLNLFFLFDSLRANLFLLNLVRR